MAYVKQNWKNGDIITADKLNHMEDGIAEGGGSVQPDWNQNDSTASDYIKNRPFYSSPEMTTLTDSTGHFEGDGQFPYLEMNLSSPVDIDDPITVTFDGVIYDDLEIKWTIHGKGTEEDPFDFLK